MNDMWREGSRVWDASDKCPRCPDGGRIIFASDFKKFGSQKIRVCIAPGCMTVFNHDDAQGPVSVNPAPREA